MSKIIYSTKLLNSENCQYFSIPVYMVKVLMTSKKENTLNHFERVILSLLSIKFQSLDELAAKTLLDKQLIELIIYKMIEKGFLDDKQKLTNKGEEALINVSSETSNKIAYLFYDLYRNCLIPNICKNSDFNITNTDNSGFFFIENDDYDEKIFYQDLKPNKNYNDINEKYIESKIRIEIFNKLQEEVPQKVKVIDFKKNIYKLITFVSLSNDSKYKNFIVANPITQNNDDELYYYFASNIENKDINNLILKVLDDNSANKAYQKDLEKKSFDLIKKELFNRPIDKRHEYLIGSIYSVLESFKDFNNTNYNDFISNYMNIKTSMTNLGDLFENVLYEIAFKYENSITSIKSITNKANLQMDLGQIAKKIGFDIETNGNKLFSTYKKSIFKIINHPETKGINECIAWNLFIAKDNPKHVFYKLAPKYPDLFSSLYYFKRVYRDTNKHSIDLGIRLPKEYFDLLFDMFDLGLNYKVNNSTIDKFVNQTQGSTIEYSEIYIKANINKTIIDSNSADCTKLKVALLSMYSSYICYKCNYLTYAYSIYDDILKQLLLYFKNECKACYYSFNSLFKDKTEVINFLANNGFRTLPFDAINSKIENIILFSKDDEKLYHDNFKNGVINSEIRMLIMMIKTNKKVMKQLTNVENIFVIGSTLSYLGKHQQVHDFNKKHADIIVSEIIDLVNLLSYIYK